MNLTPALSAVILAGGASSRMGTHKALLNWHGEPVAQRLARLFTPVIEDVLLVLGHEAAAIHAALPPNPRLRTITNYHPERGMLSSLQTGLRSIRPSSEAVFFLPVDYPAISPHTITAMIKSWLANPATPILLPRHDGRRGHPVLIARTIADELLRLAPTQAAHEVIRAGESRIRYLDLPDPAIHRDADDPAAFAALLQEFPR